MIITKDSFDPNHLSKFKSPEFYQKPYYLELEAQTLDGEAVYYMDEGEDGTFLIPLIKRPFSDKYSDLISPYGYAGFLTDNDSTRFITDSLERFHKFCADHGFISSFLRLHPFNNVLLPENSAVLQKLHGKVVFFSLKSSYEELQRHYSSNHKRGIKKLIKQGFTIKTGTAADIDNFMEIYNNTMDRLKAKPYYYFDKTYYSELLKNEDTHLIFVESPDGRLCAGGLFVKSSFFIQYHLGGTIDHFLPDAPVKLIFDHVISLYAGTDLMLNLGGGLNGEEDSLFNFKKGFSAETIKFSTIRMVHNVEAYNNLCSGYSKDDRRNLDGFFPLYRS